MRNRRVLLCLPKQPSENALALARAVKAALSATYQVRLQLEDGSEDFDDDATPVDSPIGGPLVLRIEDPPDGGERTM
jgi:hypothetical protein